MAKKVGEGQEEIFIKFENGDNRNTLENIIKKQQIFSQDKYIGDLKSLERRIYEDIVKIKGRYENKKGKEKTYDEMTSQEKVQFWTAYFNPTLSSFLENNQRRLDSLSDFKAFQLILSSKNFSNTFNDKSRSFNRHNLLRSLFWAAKQEIDKGGNDIKMSTFNKTFDQLEKPIQEQILDEVVRIFFSETTEILITVNDMKIKIQKKTKNGGIITINNTVMEYSLLYNEGRIESFNTPTINEETNVSDFKKIFLNEMQKQSVESLSINIGTKSYAVSSSSGGKNVYRNTVNNYLLSALKKDQTWENETILSNILSSKIISKADDKFVVNYLSWFEKALEDGRYLSEKVPDYYKKRYEKLKLDTAEMEENWKEERKIFNILKESLKNSTKMFEEIFQEATQQTFEVIKSSATGGYIDFNFGFSSVKINSDIIDKANKDKNFKKLYTILKQKKGFQLIKMLYSDKIELGSEGEISALLELPEEFKSGGQTHDIFNDNGNKVDLGQSFQDIKGNNYGINVKHFLYQGGTIALYNESIFVGAEKELKYKYTNEETFKAVNLLAINKDIYKNKYDEGIIKLLKPFIGNFMRMEWNGQYCLFYRLSNFYYPASIIYEQCIKQKKFFEMKYQAEDSLRKMKEEGLKNQRNLVSDYFNDDNYKKNKINYGLNSLKIKELTGI